MKKLLGLFVAAIAGISSFANAGLMDMSVIDQSNAYAPSVTDGNFVYDSVNETLSITGYIFNSNSYLVYGEDGFTASASDTITYSMDVTSADNNDDFEFSLVALDTNDNVIASTSELTLMPGETQTLSLDVTGATDYSVGLKVTYDGQFEGFIATISNYTVPEPMTVSLLALGGLAAVRRRRS